MGLLDKLKSSGSSKRKSGQNQQQYAAPSGPPPSAGQYQQQQYAPPQQPYGQAPQQQFAPPAGPPPSGPAGAENALAALKRYDTVFIVDDSGSMWGESWDSTRDALAGVVQEAVKYDQDGVDVYFFNYKTACKGVNSTQEVMRIFNKIDPRYSTPTASAMRQFTEPYMRSLEAWKANPSGPKPKPVNLVVLTDGAPNKGEEPDQLIIDLANRLEAGRFPLSQFGIQFIQIGNDSEAREALSHLDDNLTQYVKRDIVDTVLFDPSARFDGNYILKALLGAINRKIDSQD